MTPLPQEVVTGNLHDVAETSTVATAGVAAACAICAAAAVAAAAAVKMLLYQLCTLLMIRHCVGLECSEVAVKCSVVCFDVSSV